MRRQFFSVVLCNLIRQLACCIKSCLQNQVDPREQGVAQSTSVRQLVEVAACVTDTPEYLYTAHARSQSCKDKPTVTFTWDDLTGSDQRQLLYQRSSKRQSSEAFVSPTVQMLNPPEANRRGSELLGLVDFSYYILQSHFPSVWEHFLSVRVWLTHLENIWISCQCFYLGHNTDITNSSPLLWSRKHSSDGLLSSCNAIMQHVPSMQPISFTSAINKMQWGMSSSLACSGIGGEAVGNMTVMMLNALDRQKEREAAKNGHF